MNLNKIFLLGRLTRDPELRVTPSGKTIVNLGLATNSIRQDKEGNRQTMPEFHNIVLFGRLGEVASQYLKKGNMCLIVGRIQTRSWQGKDGITRKRTEVVAEELQLGPKGNKKEELIVENQENMKERKKKISHEENVQEKPNPKNDDNSEEEINVEDIPF